MTQAPAGAPTQLAPGIVRVIAPNPSPMTFWGTNSYILGTDRLTVIDPGPDSAAHLAALTRAIGTRPVDQIIVTHSHLDHSPLARPLSQATGAPILAFGDSNSGQSEVMRDLAKGAGLDGGEGIDRAFQPDSLVHEGQVIDWSEGALTVLHTPGHMGNHICLRWGDALFSGDHIMGWASSLVSPPDGDLTDFMASCARLMAEPNGPLYPGHGDVVTGGHTRVAELIVHRKGREQQILNALTRPMTAAEIAQAVYTDTAPALLPAAARNVLAHLIDLAGRGKVTPQGTLTAQAKFAQSDAKP